MSCVSQNGLQECADAAGKSPVMRNTLYYGDNLPILRKYVPDESVDLVYLDPPFNSNQDYNVLFKEQSGESSPAQIKAFTDTWKWTERSYADFCEECPRPQLVDLVQGLVNTLGRNDVTAYLVMMAPRLLELHRVLKQAGSLYLHCDPSASHYLKCILDVVFRPQNFRNEIVWKRTTAHANVGRRYGIISDSILFYAKSASYAWNPQHVPYSEEHTVSSYRYTEEKTGRRYASRDLTASMQRASSGQLYEWRGIRPPASRCWAYAKEQMERFEAEGRIIYSKNDYPRLKVYLDEMPGVPLQNIWLDISVISAQSAERLGYPTQKPLALLERIIKASSKPGDLVMDPFCGCGTAIAAAQKLERRWIGVDVTHLAIALVKYRLGDAFDIKEKLDYDVVGEPTTASEARALAASDRHEFQKWAVGLVNRARPYQEKKGADRGIDGVLFFKDDASDAKKCVIQVKSGRAGAGDIRDFRGVVEREKATLGLFITLDQPTRPMIQEADSFGFYVTPLGNRRIPRLQIRTVQQMLAGQAFLIPSAALLMGVNQAEAVKRDVGQNGFEF